MAAASADSTRSSPGCASTRHRRAAGARARLAERGRPRERCSAASSSPQPDAFAALVRHTYFGYYGHPTVIAALGLDPTPVHPARPSARSRGPARPRPRHRARPHLPGDVARAEPGRARPFARVHFMKDLRDPTCFCMSLRSFASLGSWATSTCGFSSSLVKEVAFGSRVSTCLLCSDRELAAALHRGELRHHLLGLGQKRVLRESSLGQRAHAGYLGERSDRTDQKRRHRCCDRQSISHVHSPSMSWGSSIRP